MCIYIVISWWTVTLNTLEAQMKVLPPPSSARGVADSAARQFTQDTQSEATPLKPFSAGRLWMIHSFSTQTKEGTAKPVCIIQDCILNKSPCSANCYNVSFSFFSLSPYFHTTYLLCTSFNKERLSVYADLLIGLLPCLIMAVSMVMDLR